ncbi:hypothetical protein [Paenibacillus naphthalenovorans]|uniref:Uncharacterized protein n=1 Tax=Paenibacillus naphthalenovorans TaxID=162209 RepID=A0A0U2UG52_9BACL|nr:hypothetical protein [Paenibacillus naphthalenovorans]ALS22156.1 hypothetical protein IJ22_17820 [Paenibacillus naphthalenovorans]
MKKYWVGCFQLTPFYNDRLQESIFKNMVITDEYLDELGDQFQNTVAKHERGWTFDEWCAEMVGTFLWGTTIK